MKHVYKSVAFFLSLMLLVAGTCSICVFADEAETKDGFYFNDEKISWVIRDEVGNVVDYCNVLARPIYREYVELRNGETIYFYNELNQPFEFNKDTHVSMAAMWASTSSFSLGYDVDAVGSDTTVFFETGAYPTANVFTGVDIPQTDSYIFWVKNTSSDARTLNLVQITTDMLGQD